MARIAYVNGQYVDHRLAAVHIEDRGYQFADGVYEVCHIADGRILDEQRHLSRLWRSLRELRIEPPMGEAALKAVIRETIRRNRVRDGMFYLQVTRGVAPRDHPFPADTPSSLVITVKRVNRSGIEGMAAKGVKVITRPDERWKRRDIKSVSLLPNVLAKQAAKEAGAFEAFLVDDDGFVTEGSSTNAWIVDKAGDLVTRTANENILGGITRSVVLDAAKELGIRLVERPFTVDELKAAREVFLTASTIAAVPVTEVDGQVIGNGEPGSVTLTLREKYKEIAEKT